jgi:hypothetical protein
MAVELGVELLGFIARFNAPLAEKITQDLSESLPGAPEEPDHRR